MKYYYHAKFEGVDSGHRFWSCQSVTDHRIKELKCVVKMWFVAGLVVMKKIFTSEMSTEARLFIFITFKIKMSIELNLHKL